MEKIEKLREFAATIENTRQKSKNWYEERKFNIGGSEVAAIMGMSPYSNLKSVIKQKIGMAYFAGNDATRWGILFEPCSREIFSRIALSDVIEIGSIDGFVCGHRYSPDGLAVYNDNIVLLEFKAPLKSIPNGTIPQHYLPQVMSGLANIPICHIGIFVNISFRKCSLDAWDASSSFDSEFHAGEVQSSPPILIGIIWIAAKRNNFKNPFSGKKMAKERGVPLRTILEYKNKAGDQFDFGGHPPADFLRMIESGELIAAKHTICAVSENPYLAPTEIPAFDIESMEFMGRAEELNLDPIGYLPWKAFKMDIIEVARDEQMILDIKKNLDEAVDILHGIVRDPNPQKKYRELFDHSISSSPSVITSDPLE